MRNHLLFTTVIGCSLLASCSQKGTDPIDPYEPFNRKVYNFNMAFDATVVKPPTLLYKKVVPAPLRKGINNAFNNLDMIPTVANDLLQIELRSASRDTMRFVINSTLGIAGLFDVAEKMGLPLHYNDLGVTFAKWGDKNSPYLVIPILGPSTVRDGTGWLVQFLTYSPYVFIKNDTLVYSLLGLRYIDLRSQFLDSESVMDEALDKYTFFRDVYLQNRNHYINGADQEVAAPEVAGDAPNQPPSDYVDE